MKKMMMIVTVWTCVAMVILGMINRQYPSAILLALAITAGTIFYHFGMRLVVGLGINAVGQNRVDYTKKWFQPRGFEESFYKKIQVKKWKKYVPTFAPDTFQLDRNSGKAILQASCQAEIVHEVIMVLSLVPILFSFRFDSLGVFVITSAVAWLIDSVFVILQRYNRPRLLRLAQREDRKNP